MLILHQIQVREKAYYEDYTDTSSIKSCGKLQKEKVMQEVHSTALDSSSLRMQVVDGKRVN